MNIRRARIELPNVEFPIPDSNSDRRTYERISDSLYGVRDMLEEYRRNEGAVGYATLNAAMGCSKASVANTVNGNDDEANGYLGDMSVLVEQFQTATLPEHLMELLGDGLGHAIAGIGRNQKLDMIRQEQVETRLFGLFFPVIISSDMKAEIPELPTVRDFGCHIQAIIAGYQDLPLELATRLDEHMVKHSCNFTTSEHIEYYDRFLNIIRSIYQKLEEFNGVPGYVINNSFWRGSGFSPKQFRIKMLIIRQTENQEHRLFQRKLVKELQRSL